MVILFSDVNIDKDFLNNSDQILEEFHKNSIIEELRSHMNKADHQNSDQIFEEFHKNFGVV